MLLLVMTISPGLVGGSSDEAGGQILKGRIETAVFQVPVGATWVVADDLTIHATDIFVNGALVAAPRETSGEDGANIILEAERFLIVTGILRAGDGGDGIHPLENVTSVARPGGDGGSLTLRVGPSGRIHLSAGGLVAAGNGAPGGDASAFANDAMTPVRAIGGAGGVGGSIAFEGNDEPIIHGGVRLGDGGRGGIARAIAPPGRTAAGGNVSALGGNAGDPGRLSLDSPALIEALVREGLLQPGSGARGGDALASANGVPDETGDDATVWGNNSDPGGDGATYGENGKPALAGGTADARAGHGSPDPFCILACTPFAFNPGDGGEARAYGGTGGNGGRGHNGKPGLGWFDSSATWGGDGGNGGNAGVAIAYGGDGSCARAFGVPIPYMCSDGGDATAVTYAGWGGDGGNGGYGNKDNLNAKAQCGAQASKAARPFCWIEVLLSSTPTCGHVGRGGLAGRAQGYATAEPGSGGQAYLGPTMVYYLGAFATGYNGVDGRDTKSEYDGQLGRDGAYDLTFCPSHNPGAFVSHGHI